MSLRGENKEVNDIYVMRKEINKYEDIIVLCPRYKQSK